MGVEAQRNLIGQAFCCLLLCVLTQTIVGQQEGPRVGPNSVLFEVVRVQHGRHGHVVERPRILPVGVVLHRPLNVGRFRGRASGLAHGGQFVKDASNMRVPWMVQRKLLDGVDGRQASPVVEVEQGLHQSAMHPR